MYLNADTKQNRVQFNGFAYFASLSISIETLKLFSL